MTPPRQALILVASPQAHKSVSHSLGICLSQELSKRSVAAPLAYVSFPKQSAPSIANLHGLMDASDILVFLFPLTLDQPPACLVKVLEDYAWHRKSLPLPRGPQAKGQVVGVPGQETKSQIGPGPSPPPQAVVAIAHSRFPEAHQNDSALDILKRFAELEGLQWMGGLALGGSGTLPAGRPLTSSSFAARHAVKALEKTATALSRGLPVPKKAVRLMRQPAIPGRIYTWGVNWLVKRRALRAGTLHHIQAKPYDLSSHDLTEG